MIFVGHDLHLLLCGEDASLQTIYENGRWYARIRKLDIGEGQGTTEDDAVRALTQRLRIMAAHLDQVWENK
jgi:hypothetical protein